MVINKDGTCQEKSSHQKMANKELSEDFDTRSGRFLELNLLGCDDQCR